MEKVFTAVVLFTLVAGLLPVSFAAADTDLVDETVLLVDGLPADSTDSNTAEVSEVIFDTDIDDSDTEVVIISEDIDVCANIPEAQEIVPDGSYAEGNQCYPITELERVYVVSGHKYECINDPEAYEGEGGYNCDTPVQGWKIIMTSDVYTFATYTDADGAYSFILPDGEWEISEAESDYWQQYFTAENGRLVDSYTCNFDFRTETEAVRAEGADADGYCDFGNVHITYPITGFKWNDANANGMKDEGESGIEGWKISAYEGDGKATRYFETTTDEDGAYTLDLEKGEWTVFEEVRAGWTQTALEQDGEIYKGPGMCEFSIVYSDEAETVDEESVDDCTFYNQYKPTYVVTGIKWSDKNGNGVQDDGEEGVAGWTIYANKNDNAVVATSTLTNARGEYTFTIPSGIWKISEEVRVGWKQTKVEQTGEVVRTEGEVATTCTFNLGVYFYKKTLLSEDNNCIFLNQQEIAVEEPETPRRGGGGSGTRVKDRATPTPQVLGASTTSTTVPVCGMYLTDYMRMGKEASSTEVTKLQVFLNAVGIKTALTGIFDTATDAAVRAFQMQYKPEVLTPWYVAKLVPHENSTGWVYQLTRWKINNIVCPGSESYPVLN